MKTRKTRKTKQAAIPTGCNTSRSVPLATIHEQFKQSVGKAADGSNDYVGTFVSVMERVMDLMPSSFSIHDVRRESIAYEIPEPELTKFFKLWTSHALASCRLEKVNGCYGYPVFVRI